MIQKPKKTNKKKIPTPLPELNVCSGCGTPLNLEVHHVYFGNNRNNSNIYGCTVYLCSECHRGTNGVHNGNKELDLRLKREQQEKLESRGMKREEFIFFKFES